MAPWPAFRRGRFPLSRWRRQPILSVRRLSAIASHISPSAHHSTSPMDRRSHRKKVAKSHKPMRMLTKPPAAWGRTLLVNLRMTAFGVRGRRAVLPLAARDDPQCVVRQRPPQRRTCTSAPDVYVSDAESSSHSRLHRVSSFRWLPRSATAPIPNCLDFGRRSRPSRSGDEHGGRPKDRS
jgi:hypothetical protein